MRSWELVAPRSSSPGEWEHERAARAEKLLEQLQPGNTLVVWRLDRLGRSIRHLIDLVAELDNRGVGFRSLQERIDATSPGGKLVFHVFAAWAEFERDLVRERTMAGLQAARARGRNGGRPAKMTPAKIRRAPEMCAGRSVTVEEIAQVRGVSRSSLPTPRRRARFLEELSAARGGPRRQRR